MTKKEMSIKIASALLNADVDENNWKVQDLMKRSKSVLEDHMKIADRIELNENEMKVLKSLVNSSEGNGHDFGWTDEYEECGLSKHQVAGYIGQLSTKGYIDLYDLSEDDGVVTNAVQFEFTEKAKKMLNIS